MPQMKALTPDQAVEMLASYVSGEPMVDLAKRYGVTPECLSRYRKQAGVPKRPLVQPLDEELVVGLWNEGMGMTPIARQIGAKPERVAATLRAAGIEPYDRRGVVLSLDEQYELAGLHAEGWTTTQLIAKYGVERSTVPAIVKRLGGKLKKGRPVRRIFSDEDVARMARLWAEGWSQHAIGKEYETAQVVVSRVLRSAGIEPTARQKRARGADHGSWKGGRSVTSDGKYVLIYVETDDPLASMRNHTGYVLEHRLAMARALGRPLDPLETVHHISGDSTDNRIANLQLRQGRHGKGVVMVCQNCGSQDIVSTVIADEADGDLVLFD